MENSIGSAPESTAPRIAMPTNPQANHNPGTRSAGVGAGVVSGVASADDIYTLARRRSQNPISARPATPARAEPTGSHRPIPPDSPAGWPPPEADRAKSVIPES